MKSSPMMVYVVSGRLPVRATPAMMISVGSAQIGTKDPSTNGMSRRIMTTQDHSGRSTRIPTITILDSSRNNKGNAARGLKGNSNITTIPPTKSSVATVKIIRKGRTLMVTSRLVQSISSRGSSTTKRPRTEIIGETSTHSTTLAILMRVTGTKIRSTGIPHGMQREVMEAHLMRFLSI